MLPLGVNQSADSQLTSVGAPGAQGEAMVDTSIGMEMPPVRLFTAGMASFSVVAPLAWPGARERRMRSADLFVRIGCGGNRKKRGRHV